MKRLSSPWLWFVCGWLLLCGSGRAAGPQLQGEDDLAGILTDPATEWYDLPGAYQDWESGLQGLHSTNTRISADPREPWGQPNQESPWAVAGGTEGLDGIDGQFFLWRPLRAAGGRWPVVWWRQGRRIRWIFPRDTVVGEILSVDGQPFLLRTRRRLLADWVVSEHGPNVSDLAAVDPEAAAEELVRRIFGTQDLRRDDVDLGPRVRLLRRQRTVVRQRLLGRPWLRLEVDQESCRACHEDVGRNAREMDSSRHWYGQVRGDDGIFSWHPFTEDSISVNNRARTISIRDESGIERYDKDKHPSDVYRRSVYYVKPARRTVERTMQRQTIRRIRPAAQ